MRISNGTCVDTVQLEVVQDLPLTFESLEVFVQKAQDAIQQDSVVMEVAVSDRKNTDYGKREASKEDGEWVEILKYFYPQSNASGIETHRLAVALKDFLGTFDGISEPGIYYNIFTNVDLDGLEQNSPLVALKIDDTGEKSVVVLYPNPVTDYFTLRVENGSDDLGVVTLQDARGCVLWEGPMQQGDGLNMTEYANGLYFLSSKAGLFETKTISKQ